MLSGHLCRCTGYEPIVEAILDAAGRAMNLAQSLLAACERHARGRGVPRASRTRELLPRAPRGIAGGPRRSSPASGRRRSSTTGVETALLYWAAQWAGAVFVPLSWRLAEDELDYCVDGLRRRDRPARRRPAARRPRAPGRARPRRARAEPDALHLRHDRAAEGRARARTAPTAPAAWSQALQHGYRFGDRTLGVMPLYHTMGIHSLLAMHLVGGCFVPQPRWDPEEALRLIEEQRITSLYLAPTLFHDLVTPPRLRASTTSPRCARSATPAPR